MRDSREVDLAIHGSYRLRDMSSGKVIGKGTYLAESKVRLLDRGILMGLDVYPSKRLTIEPSKDASIIIDERPFQGGSDVYPYAGQSHHCHQQYQCRRLYQRRAVS